MMASLRIRGAQLLIPYIKESILSTFVEIYKGMKKNIRYKHDTDAAAGYWTRSPSGNSSKYFCGVRVDGLGMDGSASKSLGLAPVFLV